MFCLNVEQVKQIAQQQANNLDKEKKRNQELQENKEKEHKEKLVKESVNTFGEGSFFKSIELKNTNDKSEEKNARCK